MSEIRAKYALYSFLPVVYTLTGETRQGRFTFDETQEVIRLKALNGGAAPTYGIAPVVQNDFVIKRARIVSRAAPGLLASPGTLAGNFFLDAFVEDSENVRHTLDEIHLTFLQWNEWQYFNTVLKPYRDMQGYAHLSNSCGLLIRSVNFTCDDFNIQDNFVGQGVQAMLEMEVESAGLFDNDLKTIF